MLTTKVSDPPLIPEFVSELKLNAGAAAVPSGALPKTFAKVIFLLTSAPLALTSRTAKVSPDAGAV